MRVDFVSVRSARSVGAAGTPDTRTGARIRACAVSNMAPKQRQNDDFQPIFDSSYKKTYPDTHSHSKFLLLGLCSLQLGQLGLRVHPTEMHFIPELAEVRANRAPADSGRLG